MTEIDVTATRMAIERPYNPTIDPMEDILRAARRDALRSQAPLAEALRSVMGYAAHVGTLVGADSPYHSHMHRASDALAAYDAAVAAMQEDA